MSIYIPGASTGGTTPAGTATEIQYRNNTALGAIPNSAVDGATGEVTLARLLLTANGAASTSPLALMGTWFTGGTTTTTKPYFLIEPAGTPSTSWATTGTGLGVNAPSGFGGRILDLQVGGVSQYRFDANHGLNVPTTGVLSAGTNTIAQWNSTLGFNVTLLRLDIANQDIILARDAAGILAQRNGTAAQATRIYNTFTSTTNFERAKIEWASNILLIGTEKGTGGGTARAMELQTDGITRVQISRDGVYRYAQIAPAAVNTTATLTIADIQSGIVTTTTAAAVDMTLPTGTATEGGFAVNNNDLTFEWSVINTGSNTARIIANTDHTLVGAGAVTAGTAGRFATRRTAANTFVTYRIS
jgi:hypothetical protein